MRGFERGREEGEGESCGGHQGEKGWEMWVCEESLFMKRDQFVVQGFRLEMQQKCARFSFDHIKSPPGARRIKVQYCNSS